MGEIASGMPVYDASGEPLGAVEALGAGSFQVAGRTISHAAIAQVANGAVQLLLSRAAFLAHQAAATGTHDADETARTDEAGRIVIPIVEERIQIGTRQIDLGEIEIRKRVVEETRMMPVTIRREIVEIVRRDADGVELSVEEIRPTTPAPHTA